ncbi:hypothetical protein EV421DRAFT_1698236 [Armillaria borealis]|uniref:Heterokaryon incompatibility domain-containing protein n=1 Tax=Armillaria borealis TaxID=47425 RepID=A0AA39K9D5_9AGAR|nr:hypothetical protein EV421DRAFT_1698236 [Armillaria borealis]
MAPRRVWDLFSNRVVPWWVALHTPWGISHAWLDISRRKKVDTPINGHQWPVPIPEDTNLDLIHIEMLNLGAEYAWLDVLCLRQEAEGVRNEDLRAEEWMLDVPTIGNAYALKTVVCYFNGLGRPLERFDFDSDRSWFKRTWTLQETSDNWTIGGDMGDEMLNEEVRERFMSQVVSVEEMTDVVRHLSLLRDRTSEKDVDKIDPTSNDNSIGTGEPTSTIAPAYSELQSAEDAWTALVKVMSEYNRPEMLFLYHEPGPDKNAWRPSWQQAMNWNIMESGYELYWEIEHNMETGTYSYSGWCNESVQVQGLATPAAAPRKGHLIVQALNGEEHRCIISAGHQYPIPDGVYALLYYEWYGSNTPTLCVVGKMLPNQTFIKTSVFEVIGLPWDEESLLGARKSLYCSWLKVSLPHTIKCSVM